MYRMARFIDSDKYTPPTGISAPHLAMDDCAKRYAAVKHGLFRHTVTQSHARNIIDDAVLAGYIEVIGDNTPTHNGHRMRVCSGKGRQLISTDWKGSHVGLSEQTMQHYPETKEKYAMKYKARLSIMGALGGAIITVAGGIIFIYLKHHLNVR